MYADWIKQHHPYSYLAKLQCAEATQSMVAEFPELRGFANKGRLPVGAE